MTRSDDDVQGRAHDGQADSPEVEAIAAASDLVEQGEHDDILLAQNMTLETTHRDTWPSAGPMDDLDDLLGVDAAQMIAAREDADAALANRDVDQLAAALQRMGVPAEDEPDQLAHALLAAPPAVPHKILDGLEVLNTLPHDQAAVLTHQRARSSTGSHSAGEKPLHPARVAAAAVDQPADAAVQRLQPHNSTRPADPERRPPEPRAASTDRGSAPKR